MNHLSNETIAILLICLICVSAFFSSSETGMMAINRYRLRHKAQHDKTARRVLNLLKRPERLIGIILIGNNFVNILASGLATILAVRLYGDLGIAIATFTLTLVILIFAEVTPKTIAALKPERIAYPASIPLTVLLKLFYPLVWLVNLFSNAILSLFGIKSHEIGADDLSREELKTVVSEAGTLIPQRHQKMLLSILDLEQVTVDDIMIAKQQIAGIDITDDWEVIESAIISAQHTRLVVYEENLDQAIGFLHARDAISLISHEDFSPDTLRNTLREIYFIPQGTPLNTQLLKFQRNKKRIGLVVNEYGDIQGLVTLEDILEEIVGEFTTDFASTHNTFRQESDGSYLVDGRSSIRSVNKLLGTELPSEAAKTMSGLLIEVLETIPSAGTCLKIEDYPVEVVKVKDNRIELLRIGKKLN